MPDPGALHDLLGFEASRRRSRQREREEPVFGPQRASIQDQLAALMREIEQEATGIPVFGPQRAPIDEVVDPNEDVDRIFTTITSRRLGGTTIRLPATDQNGEPKISPLDEAWFRRESLPPEVKEPINDLIRLGFEQAEGFDQDADISSQFVNEALANMDERQLKILQDPDKMLALLDQEAKGNVKGLEALLGKILQEDPGVQAQQNEILRDFNTLRTFAADKEGFLTMVRENDSELTDIDVEAIRQRIQFATTLTLKKDFANDMILGNLLADNSEFFSQLLAAGKMTDEFVFNFAVRYYSLEAFNMFPKGNINQYEKLARMELNNELGDNDFGEVTVSIMGSEQTFGDEASVAAKAEELGVSTETLLGYKQYRENAVSIDTMFPGQKAPKDGRLFPGGTFILSGAENAVGWTTDNILREGGNKAIDVATRPLNWSELQLGHLATRGVVSDALKNLGLNSTPILENWDDYDDVDRRGGRRAGVTKNILLNSIHSWGVLYGDNGQGAENIRDKLMVGPPEIETLDEALTPVRRNMNNEEYTQWVLGVISGEANWIDHGNTFGLDLINDPLNLALFMKPVSGIKALRATAQSARRAARLKEAGVVGQTAVTPLKLGVGKEVLGPIDLTIDLMKVPGGPGFVKLVDTASRQFDNVIKPITGETALKIFANEDVEKIVPKLFPKATGFLGGIPNPVKSRFFMGTKMSQLSVFVSKSVNAVDGVFARAAGVDAKESAKVFLQMNDELIAAWKTGAKGSSEWEQAMQAFFTKWAITPNESAWRAAKVLAENPQIVEDPTTGLRQIIKFTKKGKPRVEVGQQIPWDVVRGKLANNVVEMWGKPLADKVGPEVLKTAKGAKGFLKGVDNALMKTNNAQRWIVNRLFLTSPRFHIRNIVNDRFFGFLDGFGNLWGDVRHAEKYFQDLGLKTARTQQGALSGISSDAGIEFITKGDLSQPVSFKKLAQIFTGNPETANLLENGTRLRLQMVAHQRSYAVLNEQLLDDATQQFAGLVKANPKLTPVFEAYADEVIDTLAMNNSPAALDRVTAQIRKGVINTKPRLDKVTGVRRPAHLEMNFYRDLQNALSTPKSTRRYFRQMLGDVDTPGQLRSDLLDAVTKYSPRLADDMNEATDFYIDMMEFWVARGANTEEAMAATLGAHAEEVREMVALRGVNHQIRQVDSGLADELDDALDFIFKDTRTQIRNIHNPELITDKSFMFGKGKTPGVVQQRMQIWKQAVDDARRLQVVRAGEVGIHDIGIWSRELKQGIGVETVLAQNEFIRAPDAIAGWNAPAEWYLRRARGKALAVSRREGKVVGDAKKQLLETVNTIKKSQTNNLRLANEYGQIEADRLFFNYAQIGDIDFLMKFIFPWQFWITRAWPRYMELSMRKPYIAAFFAKMSEEMDNNEDLLRLRNKLKVPFLGDIGEFGTAYIDPMRVMVPTDFVDNITFESQMESRAGKFLALSERFGLGVTPIGSAAAAIAGLGEDSEYARYVSTPPGIDAIGMAIVRGLNTAGLTDRKTLRITPVIKNRLAQELDLMLVLKQISPEEHAGAIIAYNESFGELDVTGLNNLFTHPTIENAALKQAYDRVTKRTQVETAFGFTTGVPVSFRPPGTKERKKIKEEFGPKIDAAFKALSLGNPELLEELENDPEFGIAMQPSTRATTEFEATRWLARNNYWGRVNIIDEQLDRDLLGLDTFDPRVADLKGAASIEKRQVLRDVINVTGLEERQIIGGNYAQLDMIRLVRRIIEGTSSPAEISKAMNVASIRAFTRVLSLDPEDFVDQGGVFDGAMYHELKEQLEGMVPDHLKKDFNKWKKRDATVQEATKDAWEELYSNTIWFQISLASMNLDKEVRATKIEDIKDNALMPSNEEIIAFISREYPQLNPREVRQFVEDSFLPNFEGLAVLSTEEDMRLVRSQGRNFRSANGTVVTKENVDDFEDAWKQFQVWKFAKDNDVRTTGLWTDAVERYWGNDDQTGEKVLELNQIDSEIERILVNADTNDIDELIEKTPRLAELIEMKQELIDSINIDDARDNVRYGRTTSFSRSAGQGGVYTSISSGGMALVMANVRAKSFIELDKAMRSDRQLKPEVAAEFFAAFKKRPMGFRDFESWLKAAWEAWLREGQPGDDFISKKLGEAAKALSPGETIGTIE